MRRTHETEIDYLHGPIVGQEKVLGGHVAVNDLEGLSLRIPKLVGSVETLAGVCDDPRDEVARSLGGGRV
jgi:hypothetical protein